MRDCFRPHAIRRMAPLQICVPFGLARDSIGILNRAPAAGRHTGTRVRGKRLVVRTNAAQEAIALKQSRLKIPWWPSPVTLSRPLTPPLGLLQ